MPFRFDPGVEIVHDFVQDRTEGLALPASCPMSRRYVIFRPTGENCRRYENGTCDDPHFAFLPLAQPKPEMAGIGVRMIMC